MPKTAIIIGAGPAGLSAAVALRRRGIERVVVLEREADPGGIPRHCGHPHTGPPPQTDRKEHRRSFPFPHRPIGRPVLPQSWLACTPINFV